MNKIGFILGLAITGVVAFKSMALPNPWIECGEDIGCGAAKAGFNFPLRVADYRVRAMQDMLEIRFPLNDKRNIIIRKSVMPQGEADANGIIDISGDYNKYPVNQTVTIENGVKFSARGEKNKYKVVNFAAETGYYSIMCTEGLNIQDIEYLYKLLEDAEAPRYDEEENRIEEAEDSRRIDGVVEPIYTRDCFPKTLQKKGVTKDCFTHANLGQDIFCTTSEIKQIREYYLNGQENDPLNDGSGNFCADELN